MTVHFFRDSLRRLFAAWSGNVCALITRKFFRGAERRLGRATMISRDVRKREMPAASLVRCCEAAVSDAHLTDSEPSAKTLYILEFEIDPRHAHNAAARRWMKNLLKQADLE
jgi:hypothetical protein